MTSDLALLRHYAEIWRGRPEHGPVAVLHIGAGHTTFMWGKSPDHYASLQLGAGSGRTAGEHFRHSPPTPLELENAIAAVEDQIMRVRALLPQGGMLYSADPAILGLARLAGVSGDMLPVQEVERVFSRLAAVSLGAPASLEQLPTDAALYATAVILRELMHHLGYASIALRTAPRTDASDQSGK